MRAELPSTMGNDRASPFDIGDKSQNAKTPQSDERGIGYIS